MPFSLTPPLAALLVAGLVALVVVAMQLVRAFTRYRGTSVVVCPETRELVAVEVDARRAALGAVRGRPGLSLQACTRWPERAGCGQECLAQIEWSPESCLLRHLLGNWYRERRCALCGAGFEPRRLFDHEPGLRAPDGAIRGWDGFRPEQVVDVLATHAPVCWNCRIAEGFRREHPELVTDRPPRRSPPPSMA